MWMFKKFIINAIKAVKGNPFLYKGSLPPVVQTQTTITTDDITLLTGSEDLATAISKINELVNGQNAQKTQINNGQEDFNNLNEKVIKAHELTYYI